jgi:hypothetical protein
MRLIGAGSPTAVALYMYNATTCFVQVKHHDPKLLPWYSELCKETSYNVRFTVSDGTLGASWLRDKKSCEYIFASYANTV